ncbi:MAG TPA: hypothetical protein VIU87_09760, partial [Mycobacterium sp.]
TARVMGRADAAFYRHDLVAAMVKNSMWFSITARMNTAVQAAITRIGGDAWTAITYPQAVWEGDTVREDAVSAAITQRSPIPTKRAGRCWVSVQPSRAARHKGQPTATG